MVTPEVSHLMHRRSPTHFFAFLDVGAAQILLTFDPTFQGSISGPVRLLIRDPDVGLFDISDMENDRQSTEKTMYLTVSPWRACGRSYGGNKIKKNNDMEDVHQKDLRRSGIG